jgi:hypothetical protein
MSISFYPCAYDSDQNLYTVLPAAGDESGDVEFSLCNANGVELLCALGLAPEPTGVLPIEAFRNQLTAALRRRLNKRSPQLAPAEQVEPGKVTVIFLGRAEGYVERRLGELMERVQRARVVGATHFGWG